MTHLISWLEWATPAEALAFGLVGVAVLAVLCWMLRRIE